MRLKFVRTLKNCTKNQDIKPIFGQDAEFIFYEEYKDQAALEYHNKSEYLKQFFSNITPLLAGKPIVEVF
jgi:quinol monooxygenase YgiN